MWTGLDLRARPARGVEGRRQLLHSARGAGSSTVEAEPLRPGGPGVSTGARGHPPHRTGTHPPASHGTKGFLAEPRWEVSAGPGFVGSDGANGGQESPALAGRPRPSHGQHSARRRPLAVARGWRPVSLRSTPGVSVLLGPAQMRPSSTPARRPLASYFTFCLLITADTQCHLCQFQSSASHIVRVRQGRNSWSGCTARTGSPRGTEHPRLLWSCPSYPSAPLAPARGLPSGSQSVLHGPESGLPVLNETIPPSTERPESK